MGWDSTIRRGRPFATQLRTPWCALTYEEIRYFSLTAQLKIGSLRMDWRPNGTAFQMMSIRWSISYRCPDTSPGAFHLQFIFTVDISPPENSPTSFHLQNHLTYQQILYWNSQLFPFLFVCKNCRWIFRGLKCLTFVGENFVGEKTYLNCPWVRCPQWKWTVGEMSGGVLSQNQHLN